MVYTLAAPSTGPALTWVFIAYFLVFVVCLGARLAVPGNTLALAPADPALGRGPRRVAISPPLLGSSEIVMALGMSYMLMTML